MFSLDYPTITTLKTEARTLREERAKTGQSLSHSAALEAVAHAHGYRDWNAASAALPDRPVIPAQVGQRVEGTYLGQAFTGTVLGVQLTADMQRTTVTVRFDEPVDVVKSELFSSFRQRVTAVLDARGISLAHTSDGEPHMRLKAV